MKKLFALIIPLLLSGCGHTMYHKVEGTGLYGRIPLPNGNSLFEVAIGDMNITSGILRGGAILDENTSKGGTFGTVSIGRHTTLTTVPALNEGNIRDVLTSPNTDDKTKQLIAEYLISRPQPPRPNTCRKGTPYREQPFRTCPQGFCDPQELHTLPCSRAAALKMGG